MTRPGPFTPSQQEHLDSGKSLLLVRGCDDGAVACIFLVRQGSDDSIAVAKVNPQYLWTARTSAPDLHVCVLSAERTILFCSEQSMDRDTGALPVFRHVSGAFQWEAEGVIYDGAFWKLLLGPTFLEEPWTVVVSQPHDEAIAPLVHFRRDFVLVILLAVWIVLFFSLVQVRRTLGPLTRLQEGTQKIGSGRFDTRVEVSSGDEFEELAGSFNRMAAHLGRQFHTLKTIHEVDQAIFASLDQEGIVDGVLSCMPKLIPCDGFAVCVLDENRSAGWVRYQNGARGMVHTHNTAISDEDWLRLQGSPLGFSVEADERTPGFLAPLTGLGDAVVSGFAVPLRRLNPGSAGVCTEERHAHASGDEGSEAGGGSTRCGAFALLPDSCAGTTTVGDPDCAGTSH